MILGRCVTDRFPDWNNMKVKRGKCWRPKPQTHKTRLYCKRAEGEES